jgi:glycosyltransferase involved in cell wall biosynthesis
MPPISLVPQACAAEGNSPVRVLQVFNQYIEIGGEEVWVETMSRLGQGRVEFYELRFHSRAWKGRGAPGFFRQALWLGDNPRARQRLREEVATVKPHLLVFHNLIPVASCGLYDEARKLGLPVIQYIHNFRPFSPSGTLWIRNRIDDRSLRGKILPEIFARSWEGSWLKTALLGFHLELLKRGGALDTIACWIAVSEFMRQKFIEAGIAPEKIVALRHCWVTAATGESDEEGNHYLFLGRMVPEKGVYVLLAAWEKLEAMLGDGCPRIVIAGTGPDEARIHSLAARLSKVECVGFVTGERKERLIRTCRGLIAPSIWWEPLGLIVYEAYEAFRPVIASRSGGLTETVVPEVTGYLHEPGNPESLASCVIQLEQAGATERLRMGRNGHDWLRENATPQLWIRQFRSIIDPIIRSHSNNP